jgi:conserved oligomeric Golgi complex subunit 8
MADSLRELLAPYLSSTNDVASSTSSPTVGSYLAHLTTLPLSALSSTEPQWLSRSSNSNNLQLRQLAFRSHKSTITSVGHLSTLTEALPAITASVSELRNSIPHLDQQAVQFSTTYSKSRDDNLTLERRKNGMLLSRQVDKVSDMLELPSLLSTAIASAGSGLSTGANYSQALELFSHIKRLQILYPDSSLVKSVLLEAEVAMRDMTTNLITSLRSQNIRLAAAIRTIGFLRRVAPELGCSGSGHPPVGMTTQSASSEEGLFGSLFLTARLANLLSMLEALSPLRDLADQETSRRLVQQKSSLEPSNTSTGIGYVNQGQQTERYLKRYIEIFREQSFATISVYRNVFPSSEEIGSSTLQFPSALATFPLHMVDILMETLKTYLPNITEPQARESLLTQVLYAAGSLGRLGADFSMMLALLEEDENERKEEDLVGEEVAQNGDAHDQEKEPEPPEWARAIAKHRIQSARLEALTTGH